MAMQLYDLCGADRDLRFSPHCWKAKLALAHKGLAFETVPVPFTAIPEIGGGAFTRTVPVLDHDGKLIRDSFAIATYLDEIVPEKPLFGPDGTAFARYVEGTMSITVHSIVTRMILTNIHGALAEKDQHYFRQSRERGLGGRLEEVHAGVDALTDDLTKACFPIRHVLKGSPWLGGAAPLFVDYIAAGGLLWLYTFAGGLPLKADDPVAQWFGRILDLHGGLARSTLKTAA